MVHPHRTSCVFRVLGFRIIVTGYELSWRVTPPDAAGSGLYSLQPHRQQPPPVPRAALRPQAETGSWRWARPLSG